MAFLLFWLFMSHIWFIAAVGTIFNVFVARCRSEIRTCHLPNNERMRSRVSYRLFRLNILNIILNVKHLNNSFWRSNWWNKLKMSQFGLFCCIWLIIDMFVYYKFHVCPSYKTVNHENVFLGIILYFIIKSLTKPTPHSPL